MAVLVTPLVFRAPRGAGLLGVPVGGGPPASRPCREPLARRVGSKPGQAPPPPTGTAAWPSGPSGALHTSGAWRADVWFGALARCPARPRHHPRAPQPGPPVPPAPSTPATPGVLTRGWAPRHEARLWLSISNFARNSSMTHSIIEFTSLELQRFWDVSKNDRDKLRARFGWRWCRRRPWISQPGAAHGRRSQALLVRCPVV